MHASSRSSSVGASCPPLNRSKYRPRNRNRASTEVDSIDRTRVVGAASRPKASNAGACGGLGAGRSKKDRGIERSNAARAAGRRASSPSLASPAAQAADALRPVMPSTMAAGGLGRPHTHLGKPAGRMGPWGSRFDRLMGAFNADRLNVCGGGLDVGYYPTTLVRAAEHPTDFWPGTTHQSRPTHTHASPRPEPQAAVGASLGVGPCVARARGVRSGAAATGYVTQVCMIIIIMICNASRD